jgi:hypothetical protein
MNVHQRYLKTLGIDNYQTLKKRCISLVVGRSYPKLHEGMTKEGVGPPQLDKHIPPK